MKETKGTYICQYFKMPHLYRRDLEAIENIFQTQLKSTEYHIAFDGIEYERLDQIPPEKKKTHVLIFFTHNPCVRLKFAHSWAELYCAETNNEISEGLEQMKQILLASERRTLWRLAKYSNWSAPLIGLGAVGLASIEIGQGRLPTITMFWALGVLAAASLWWFVAFFLMVQRFSCLEFQRAAESSN